MNGLFQKLLPGLVLAGLVGAITTGTGLAVLASEEHALEEVVEVHRKLPAHPAATTELELGKLNQTHTIEKLEDVEKKVDNIDVKLDKILRRLPRE